MLPPPSQIIGGAWPGPLFQRLCPSPSFIKHMRFVSTVQQTHLESLAYTVECDLGRIIEFYTEKITYNTTVIKICFSVL